MIDFPTKPLTYPCDSYVANLKATFHEHREVFISRLRSNHLLHCGAKIGIFGATHYVCLSTNRRGAIFAASLECKHSDSALDYTPCELAFFKAVLRTMFCLRQNARGAIFAASLECKHSDSALLDYQARETSISLRSSASLHLGNKSVVGILDGIVFTERCFDRCEIFRGVHTVIDMIYQHTLGVKRF